MSRSPARPTPGKERERICAAVALLVACLFGILLAAPRPSFAYEIGMAEHQPAYFSYHGKPYGTDRFRTEDGIVAYCLDLGKKGPDETTYPSSFDIDDGLRNLLLHGYPTATAPNGLSDDQWEEATQLAIWISRGASRSAFAGDDAFMSAADRLVEAYQRGTSEILTVVSPEGSAALPQPVDRAGGLWRCGPFRLAGDLVSGDVTADLSGCPKESYIGSADGTPLQDVSPNTDFFIYLKGTPASDANPEGGQTTGGTASPTPHNDDSTATASSSGDATMLTNRAPLPSRSVHVDFSATADVGSYICWDAADDSCQNMVAAAGGTFDLSRGLDITWGEIALTKESEDNAALARTFHAEGPSGSFDFTTDEHGSWRSDPLLPGTYTITETDTPDRYVEPDPLEVEVTAGEVTQTTFTNTLKRGSLRITKTSWVEGETSAFTFQIIDSQGRVVREVEATIDRPALVDDLLIDTYTIVETNVDETVYVLPEPVTVTLTNDTYDVTQEVTIENEEAMPKLKINKVAEDTDDVSGTTFQVSRADGWSQTTSIEDGQSSVLVELPDKGAYEVSEVNVDSRYETPETQQVSALTGDTYELTFENRLKPGSLHAGTSNLLPHTGDHNVLGLVALLALVGCAYVGASLLVMHGHRRKGQHKVDR
jgi:TQXA domain-containing protein